MGHPQTNGQAKIANKVILHGLQRKPNEAKRKWDEELYGVLWSIRTIEKTATGETPLTYGFEVALHTHRLTTL